MDKLISLVRTLMPLESFDALGVGVIHFKENKFDAFEMTQFDGNLACHLDPTLYYDLASLTKPLTNSLSYFLRPDCFDKNLLLCLNHRGGLPAWGLLPTQGWREQILSYPIKESETLYSDFSALRVMLELEKKGIGQKEICQTVWDQETLNWLDLSSLAPLLQYGYKNGLPNLGAVHDPNAYVIHEFCSHAGLFSTVSGLCQTLLNYQNQTNFIEKVKADLKQHSQRFSFGWDRVENPRNSLAAVGCGEFTFGHLGFTGTSIWIDPDKMLGQVILSNATKHYWYEKQGLNDIRRAIGQLVWTGQI